MSMPATPPSPLSHHMSACGALPVQMEAEAAVGEGARLYCPNPQCSQLLVADEKHAGGCIPPAACFCSRRRRCSSGAGACRLRLGAGQMGPLVLLMASGACWVQPGPRARGWAATAPRLQPPPSADTPIDCPHCKHKLCANCGITWHAGMTCQQYQASAGRRAVTRGLHRGETGQSYASTVVTHKQHIRWLLSRSMLPSQPAGLPKLLPAQPAPLAHPAAPVTHPLSLPHKRPPAPARRPPTHPFPRLPTLRGPPPTPAPSTLTLLCTRSPGMHPAGPAGRAAQQGRPGSA